METPIDAILHQREKIERGGKEVRMLADELQCTRSPEEAEQLGYALFRRPESAVKMVAVILLGSLAAQKDAILAFLCDEVSLEQDWRVQEMLAQALHQYCSTIGYVHALPILEGWLHAAHPHVRRAAAEGPRIWTSRPYFKDHPLDAISLLARLKADESEYVRKSAGNALRDISRKHPDLLRAELSTWDITDKKILFTYKLASRFVV